MGINSIVAYTLCGAMGLGWQTAMAIIFIEGIAILLLVLCGLREAIMDAIPVSLRHGISIGLGLFIAMIGLKDGGIIVANEATMVALGKVTDRSSSSASSPSSHRRPLFHEREGRLAVGIVIASVLGIPLGVTAAPSSIVLRSISPPSAPRSWRTPMASWASSRPSPLPPCSSLPSRS